MKITISSFLIGVLFGLGLLIAGMLDPAKVQGFLNITGNWDPSLAFVMLGGIGVSLVGLKLAGNMAKPVLAELFVQPVSQHIDRKLVTGAVLFGAGWGLGGLCPGPAIAVLGVAGMDAAIFMVCMIAGLVAGRWISARL